MKKIGVVTATRAEYGLLRNVIKKILTDDDLQLELYVTGTHLVEEYGHTVDEIIEDQIPVAEEVFIINTKLSGNDGIIDTLSTAVKKFGSLFEKNKPDMLVVLGDRYELLAICEAAMVCKIPIAHISGGEITEGAMDDAVRHCITKMSHLHFPGCETYRQRIIQLGEQPDSVFNYGDVGVENIISMDYMSKREVEDTIDITLRDKYACVTFHPATLESEPPRKQMMELLKAIEQFADMDFVFTGSNADSGGMELNHLLQEYVKTHSNCYFFKSLGIRRYLSLMKNSRMVIGNSSSGIVEAPSFGIPTVNIGNRQKGRLQAESIINCQADSADIIRAIDQADMEEFQMRAKSAENPYGNGETSAGIVKEIKQFLSENKTVSKSFYDLNICK